jgi:hypothetical protein
LERYSPGESVFAKMAAEPGVHVSVSDSETLKEESLIAGPVSSRCVANPIRPVEHHPVGIDKFSVIYISGTPMGPKE